MSSPFEMAMLLCFGASWPFSVYKTWTTRSATGKSLVFLWLVLIGYLCGIVHKILYHYDLVIFFYILNTLLVLADLSLCLYFRRHAEPTSSAQVKERV